MADSTVAALAASGALVGTELFYSDNGVADVKVTSQQISNFCVGPGNVNVAFTHVLTVNNTVTFSSVDGASVQFGAGGTVLYGNQTITLSGDVAGSGATAITTTIQPAAVTYAKIQNVSATSRILGRKTAGAGSVEELTIADALGFANFAISGPATSVKTFTFPNSSQAVAMLDLADQTVSGGANVAAFSIGTINTGGSTTIDCGKAPLQFLTNNGAAGGITINAPANDGSCMVLITNSATAGTVTFGSFSVGSNTGDALTTTNAQKFTVSIWRINGTSGYRIAAHQ